MLNKVKSYLRFWNKKPTYHKKGSSYGGFQLDIDKYYALEENRKKLERINKSKFPEVVKQANRNITPHPG